MDLEIEPAPDTDEKDIVQTNGDEISDLGDRFDSDEDDKGVIVLTDAVDELVENDIKRAESDGKNGNRIDATGAVISSQEIEKALERVVDKLFSEKIDGMIAGIIEKALNREIAKLKRSLIDDTSEEARMDGP